MSTRALRLAAAAVLTAAAGTAVVWIAKGGFSETEARIVFSVIGIFLTLAVAVGALRLIELRKLRLVAWLALAVVPAELAAFVTASWYGEFGDGSNKEFTWFPTALSWAIASLVVTTLALLVHERWAGWTLFPVTFAAAVAGAGVATVMLWTNVDDGTWGRALACLSIVMAAGWLLAPVLQRWREPGPILGP